MRSCDRLINTCSLCGMLCCSLQTKTYKQGLWLRKFGHYIPKRTILWSNSPLIRKFDLGQLLASERGGDAGVRQYIDKRGRKRVVGSAKLKATQRLIRICTYKYNLTSVMYVYMICGMPYMPMPAKEVPHQIRSSGGGHSAFVSLRAFEHLAEEGWYMLVRLHVLKKSSIYSSLKRTYRSYIISSTPRGLQPKHVVLCTCNVIYV